MKIEENFDKQDVISLCVWMLKGRQCKPCAFNQRHVGSMEHFALCRACYLIRDIKADRVFDLSDDGVVVYSER